MLRGVLCIVTAIWLVPGASAEIAAERSTVLNWASFIVPEISRPKTQNIIRVQEPYCEYGVGPCGGACNEEGGKTWNCLLTELPCYQRGGRCKCEVANICWPPRR
jgi:hypothetical protein